MPDAISIGPAAVPTEVIALLLALGMGTLVFRLIGRKHPELRSELFAVGDRIVTALLVAFVVWKLTPLLFWWEAIIAEPVRILRLPGGRPGLLAGSVAFLALVVPRVWSARHLLRPILFTGFSVALSYAVVVAAISALATTTAGPPSQAIARVTAPALNSSRDGIRSTEVPLMPGDRPALVTFWATWCGPCHAEIPVKQEAFRSHGDALRVAAINMTHTESGTSEVIAYADVNGLEYPILFDRDGSIATLFGVRGTPTTIVLTAEGVVVDRWMGPSDLGRINRAVAQAQKSATPDAGGRSAIPN
ncbi:MAG: TlpA disulfide reductase family protein [Alkalispirochaeta sp.]